MFSWFGDKFHFVKSLSNKKVLLRERKVIPTAAYQVLHLLSYPVLHSDLAGVPPCLDLARVYGTGVHPLEGTLHQSLGYPQEGHGTNGCIMAWKYYGMEMGSPPPPEQTNTCENIISHRTTHVVSNKTVLLCEHKRHTTHVSQPSSPWVWGGGGGYPCPDQVEGGGEAGGRVSVLARGREEKGILLSRSGVPSSPSPPLPHPHVDRQTSVKTLPSRRTYPLLLLLLLSCGCPCRLSSVFHPVVFLLFDVCTMRRLGMLGCVHRRHPEFCRYFREKNVVNCVGPDRPFWGYLDTGYIPTELMTYCLGGKHKKILYFLGKNQFLCPCFGGLWHNQQFWKIFSL